MKILYVWDADYPWDVRVEKICLALIEGGHEVHVAARNLQRRALYENVGGIHVHRLRGWTNPRFNYFASFPLFCSPVWRSLLDSIVREHSIDLIVVRDLPMAIGAIWAGRRAGIPVILDMAEDYVSMIRDIWDARKFKGLNLIVRNPYLARVVENYTFRHIDEVMVVVDEAIDVVRKGGGTDDRVTLVGNTPDLKSIESAVISEADDAARTIQSHYSVIYTGGIQLGRGLQVVLEAMPELINRIPDFRFVVAGDGYATRILRDMIQKKGLEKYVTWLGWVPHRELRKYISACRMGIVPHYTSSHVDTTIPNKIFDYMACGLPVLTSDARPMKRIVEEAQCGKTFPSGSAAGLTEALLGMLGQESELGTNGRRAIVEKYNWETDKARLLRLIERVGIERRATPVDGDV